MGHKDDVLTDDGMRVKRSNSNKRRIREDE